jgi:hypothetical protein
MSMKKTGGAGLFYVMLASGDISHLSSVDFSQYSSDQKNQKSLPKPSVFLTLVTANAPGKEDNA